MVFQHCCPSPWQLTVMCHQWIFIVVHWIVFEPATLFVKVNEALVAMYILKWSSSEKMVYKTNWCLKFRALFCAFVYIYLFSMFYDIIWTLSRARCHFMELGKLASKIELHVYRKCRQLWHVRSNVDLFHFDAYTKAVAGHTDQPQDVVNIVFWSFLAFDHFFIATTISW